MMIGRAFSLVILAAVLAIALYLVLSPDDRELGEIGHFSPYSTHHTV